MEPSPGVDNVANAIAVDATGVYSAGYQGNDWDVWRVEKRTLDNTGGIDGQGLLWERAVDFTPGEIDEANAIAVDATGLYIAGGIQGQDVWRVEKRTLDGTGGIDGQGLLWEQSVEFVPINPNYGIDEAYAMAIDATGVYITGTQADFSNFDEKWRVEKRSLADGSLIWERAVNLIPRFAWPTAIAVDATGIYIAGSIDNGNIWRVEKRTLDGTGGIDGQGLLWEKTADIVPGPIEDDMPQGIAVDSTGVYIVGSQGRYDIWRVEKRNLDTGELIWERTADFAPGDLDMANAIAVDSTGIYIGGTQDYGDIWRVEKRTLDNTGGIDGQGLLWERTEDDPSGAEWASGIAVDATGVYVAGGQSFNIWRVEKREKGPTTCGDGIVNGAEGCEIGLDGVLGTGDDIACVAPGEICMADCSCVALPQTCSVVTVPASIDIGDSTAVMVSYSNFIAAASAASSRVDSCGLGSASLSVAISCPGGAPSGNCTFICSGYDTTGVNDISVTLSNASGDRASCAGIVSVGASTLIGIKEVLMDKDVFLESESVTGGVIIINPDPGRTVNISVFDAVTGVKDPAYDSSSNAGANITLNFGNMLRGNYRVQARLDEPCMPCKKSAIFTVNPELTAPVPETDFLLVPLIALSALAVIAISARKN